MLCVIRGICKNGLLFYKNGQVSCIGIENIIKYSLRLSKMKVENVLLNRVI